MKQFFYSLILLLVCHLAQSQDMIVTNEGDTIDCKITRITNEFIHFSVFDESGFLLLRSRLPLPQIQSYEQNKESYQDSQPADTPEIKEEGRIVIDEFDPASFRLAINTGYTYQFGGYEGTPSSYKKQLQSLWNLGAEINYFPSESFGIGVRYNRAFTKANYDFNPPIQIEPGVFISELRDESIRFNYVALSLIYRELLDDDQMMYYFLSVGLINYKSDFKGDGLSFYQSGETIGVVFGICYDFKLADSFGMGVGLEVNLARLTELDNNGVIYGADFSLSRIDLTIGFRLFR